MKMVLITWVKKTVVGPFVHGGVRGGRGMQIGRCESSESVTAEVKSHDPTLGL